jgi:hypothetical protein
MPTPATDAPAPQLTSPSKTFYVTEHVTLGREEVFAILRAAVLARAEDLTRFGETSIRSLALDAHVTAAGAVEVAGVSATLEARLDPGAAALVLHRPVPLDEPAPDFPEAAE